MRFTASSPPARFPFPWRLPWGVSRRFVYGDNPNSISEETPVRPKTPYAVTKVCAEQLCDVYGSLYGIDAISLRITEIYGRGLRMPELMNDMIKTVASGSPVDQRFHFVHVEEVARAACLAVNAPSSKQGIFNISGGPQARLGDVALRVLERLPHATIELGPGPIKVRDQQGPFDITAAHRGLGYETLWPLDRGIEDLVDYHKSCVMVG